MKRCPECLRDYYDETLRFCLDDGSALLDGPSTGDHATAILNAEIAGIAEQTKILPPRSLRTLRLETDQDTNSIAVLPFANISADDENEYFCDGLAEELLNALSKIDELKVAARTSAFSFKGKNARVSEIGEKLGVKNVLEGSVRKAGNRLRISVQLVNAADGFHLWSEQYDREFKDIFDLQDEITLSVVEALKVTLLGHARSIVLKRYTDNAEAYELFLKGRYYHFKYTVDGWKRAIEFFKKATEIDSDYAPAYAAMTSSWGFLWFFGLVSTDSVIEPMRAATTKALAIDDGLAEAHLSSAILNFFHDREWRKAEDDFKRAIELDPRHAEAISFYSMFLAFEERLDEAIDMAKLSVAIDPLSPLINMNAGWTYFTAGLMDEAREQVVKMIEIEPEFYGAYWLSGAIYLTEGKYEDAIDALKKGVSLGGHQTLLADLGSAYGLAGRRDDAEAVLNELLEIRERDYVSAICLSRVYSRLGDNDKAVEWLEKAFDEDNGEMLFFKGEIEGAAPSDPLLILGDDLRVSAIFEKMNLPKENR
ncbi:MAG TPA: tetratricopeptide repeat protein [Pyrinomonadaceae bacterium]|nr:tetratricopeptide repeat protein [Pyrinomonadaceae bacterium]